MYNYAQAKINMHVLDGGALIHRVKWEKKVTYRDVIKQCVGYVCAKYNICSVGYQSKTVSTRKELKKYELNF